MKYRSEVILTRLQLIVKKNHVILLSCLSIVLVNFVFKDQNLMKQCRHGLFQNFNT